MEKKTTSKIYSVNDVEQFNSSIIFKLQELVNLEKEIDTKYEFLKRTNELKKDYAILQINNKNNNKINYLKEKFVSKLNEYTVLKDVDKQLEILKRELNDKYRKIYRTNQYKYLSNNKEIDNKFNRKIELAKEKLNKELIRKSKNIKEVKIKKPTLNESIINKLLEDIKIKTKKYEENYDIRLKKLNDKFETEKKYRVQKDKEMIKKLHEQRDLMIDDNNLSIEKKYYELNKIEEEIASEVILSVQNLTMKFGGLIAVNDLSFEIKRGEIFGLIGPNGAGKTTVFNCITKFYQPSEGKIRFRRNEGSEIIKIDTMKVHDVISKGIARTFQNIELVYELTVLENLMVGSHSRFNSNVFDSIIKTARLRYEEGVVLNKALELLEKFELMQYKDSYPSSLPYGILKKIEFARSLMSEPTLIILDEPAAGLNEIETKELSNLILRIRDEFNVTVLLVEHDMGLVMSICDRICAINFGKKLITGTPREVQNNQDVKIAYLGGDY